MRVGEPGRCGQHADRWQQMRATDAGCCTAPAERCATHPPHPAQGLLPLAACNRRDREAAIVPRRLGTAGAWRATCGCAVPDTLCRHTHAARGPAALGGSLEQTPQIAAWRSLSGDAQPAAQRKGLPERGEAGVRQGRQHLGLAHRRLAAPCREAGQVCHFESHHPAILAPACAVAATQQGQGEAGGDGGAAARVRRRQLCGARAAHGRGRRGEAAGRSWKWALTLRSSRRPPKPPAAENGAAAPPASPRRRRRRRWHGDWPGARWPAQRPWAARTPLGAAFR